MIDDDLPWQDIDIDTDRERDMQLVRSMCPGSSSGRAPVRKAGDLDSNPDPGANFYLSILNINK